MIILRAADLKPASLDADGLTVEAIVATGADVRRRDSTGPYIERLDMTEGAFTPAALVGAPVLDTHQRDALDKVKGVVIAAWLEAGKLIARLRIDDAALWARVQSGTIRNLSVGYEVATWTPGRDTSTGLRTMTATKWTPREVSFVAVPADPAAHTRTHNMTVETTEAPDLTGTQEVGGQGVRATANAAIRALEAELHLSRSWADNLIDSGASLDQARAAALDAVRNRQTPIRTATAAVGASQDAPEIRAERMGEALYARMNPTHELSAPARQFANMGTVDMARAACQNAGIATTGLAPDSLIARALSTSDFPLALGNFTNRELRAGYDAAPSGLKQVAKPTTAKDFRLKQKIVVDTQATLEKVNEGGEFKFGGMIDGAESYKIDTFGKIIAINRQILINDDLGWTADMARKFGIEAASFEADFLTTLLISNAGAGPTMSDTVALFDTAHKNVAASGAVLSQTTLSAARLALRKQTGPGGRLAPAEARFLVVPAELETLGESVLAEITPTKTSDVNVFGGKLTLVVEPRLTSATRWYVAADPATVDGLEYAYLQGAPGPQIETKTGFEVDGVLTRVRLDFGAGFVDWRSWYANAGA